MKHNIFTIPNFITSLRLILAWPLAYAMYHEYFYTVILLGFIAILSDFLDGFLSRMLNQHSVFGKALDPFVDSVMVLSILLSLYLKEKIPLWYIQTVIGRYFVISLVLIIYRHRTKITPGSILSGKISMAVMAVALFFAWLQAIFPNTYQVSISLSAMIMIFSMLDYLYTFGYKQ
jgi:CDP-diacylglycerol--glycerol-3-phosphate 3-phosphatidyltransferase